MERRRERRTDDPFLLFCHLLSSLTQSAPHGFFSCHPCNERNKPEGKIFDINVHDGREQKGRERERGKLTRSQWHDGLHSPSSIKKKILLQSWSVWTHSLPLRSGGHEAVERRTTGEEERWFLSSPPLRSMTPQT